MPCLALLGQLRCCDLNSPSTSFVGIGAKPVPTPRLPQIAWCLGEMKAQAEEEISQLKFKCSNSFANIAGRGRRYPGGAMHGKKPTADRGRHSPATVELVIENQVEFATGEVCQQHVIAVAIDPQCDRSREPFCCPVSKFGGGKLAKSFFCQSERSGDCERAV